MIAITRALVFVMSPTSDNSQNNIGGPRFLAQEVAAAAEAKHLRRVVAAQVEFESKTGKQLITFKFRALSFGGFNLGLIGSTCTALPCALCAPARAPPRTGRRTARWAAAPPRCNGAR
jgi:hypothetical protein